MKKLFWFTHSNIDTRQVVDLHAFRGKGDPKVTINLTKFIDVFQQNEIWKRKKYRTEYTRHYNQEDFSKIKSVKIHLHSENSPYSNGHSYEKVIERYIDLKSIETSKITASGIGEAKQIAVIEIEFDSKHKVIDYLTHQEEKDFDLIFEKKLTPANIESWYEIANIKSIICEFIQFYIFNLHLNFASTKYSFSFTDKVLQTGFTTVTDPGSCYYETDKIDSLSHYIFYEQNKDIVHEIMNKTSKFWHKEIPTIHFFLNALKGTHITIDSFSKLVYTLESFFAKNTSYDFISMSIPLLIGSDISSMKNIRETLKLSFSIRNKYVHGEEIVSLNSSISKSKNLEVEQVFYDLKIIIIELFKFYLNNDLYLSSMNEKINHEMIFRFYPNGIESKQRKSNNLV